MSPAQSSTLLPAYLFSPCLGLSVFYMLFLCLFCIHVLSLLSLFVSPTHLCLFQSYISLFLVSLMLCYNCATIFEDKEIRINIGPAQPLASGDVAAKLPVGSVLAKFHGSGESLTVCGEGAGLRMSTGLVM